jgi:hypothetical protein
MRILHRLPSIIPSCFVISSVIFLTMRKRKHEPPLFILPNGKSPFFQICNPMVPGFANPHILLPTVSTPCKALNVTILGKLQCNVRCPSLSN